jgi:hypothetical protein
MSAAPNSNAAPARAVSNASKAAALGVKAAESKAKVVAKPPTRAEAAAMRETAPLPNDWNQRGPYNPILDLLDEAGVKSVSTGPVCPNCDAEMSPTAVICVHCGFNKETGEKLETFSDVKSEHENTSTFVENDTNRLMAKAEKDILNAPTSAINQDFGDGSDSIVVALGAMLAFALIIVAGVLTVVLMDKITETTDPSRISFISSTVMAALCYLFITYTAFRASVFHGLGCVLFFPYAIVFAFMQGRAMLPYAIILLMSIVIGTATGIYTFS